MERLDVLRQEKLELNKKLNELLQAKAIQIIQKYLDVIKKLEQIKKEEERELETINSNRQALCEKDGGHAWLLLDDKYVADENQTLHKYTCECILCGLTKEDINHRFKNVIMTNLESDKNLKISVYFRQMYNNLILNKKSKQESFEYINSNKNIIIEEFQNINNKVK